MSMSNDINSLIASSALGWEPLEKMRKRAKARLMYKTSNKMGPESLTKLFTYKSEMTNHTFEVFPVVFACHNLELIT